MATAGMSDTAFQKGLGAIHALSHPVGSVLDTHHGLTNAVVMPYVLAFNRKAIEEKLIRMGRYIGLKDASFNGFMQWILDLRKEIGIPHTLKDLGMSEKNIAQFSDMAAIDPCAGGNPVKAGVPEMKVMYEAALAGRL
jgi:alcohol dehydrogenase class IV